ncbi:hypothetical protein [Desulfosarcina ovata]|uniref:Radical SAM core domain-containing protein n=1 Tax=Desulfosarcina ovata subsp. ovata TaxID=2752305 RepID=A0A5K8A937_9BACT|nr:hypothetical protein [Desulfosarcina ovata]BBO89183.1 hypothetical protein DSCOOX_23630 [Desulfosarcina ovata subsp. ovata]
MGTVQQVRRNVMGRSDREETAAPDGPSEFNMGMNRRQTMHLSDNRHFFENEANYPLHEAFDRKISVHAMPRNKVIPPENLLQCWNEVMSADHSGQPLRTIYIHIPFCKGHCLFCGFYQNRYKPETAEQYVDALLKEMADQVELGYCDFSHLSSRYATDLSAIAGKVIWVTSI